MLSVILWLWSERSGPPGKFADYFTFHPNDLCRMAAAVRANLKLPHRLIAITDYPRDLFPSDIEYVALEERFAGLRSLGGCWLRLKCFSPELDDVLGPRCAWIALDSIVCGSLDPLFDRDEPIVLFNSRSIRGQNWNGSVILFSPAENRDIWSEFDPETSPRFVRDLRGGQKTGPRGTDQAWLHHRRGPETPHWTSSDGIIHWGVGGGSRTIPEHARILTFPGLLKPSSEKVRRRSPWVKQHWPLPGDDYAAPDYPVAPWPVVPSIEPPPPGRFRTLLKERQLARDARRRMVNAGALG